MNDRKKHLLAFICRICPFCVAARMFPVSRYAKGLRKAEKTCPACQAYNELYGANKKAE